MLPLLGINHIAIIATDYRRSRDFYCTILGLRLLGETYRAERDSWKGQLALSEHYLIELFSFADALPRPSYPEACGLRHLAFTVENVELALQALQRQQVSCEGVRIDPVTGKKFIFFFDPDGLPLELYQSA